MLAGSCSPADGADDGSTAAPPETVTFTRGGSGGYVIVTGTDATAREREAAAMLADAFRLKLDAEPELVTDSTAAVSHEIVVGRTARGDGGLFDSSAHRNDDWYVGLKDGKIYILGGSDTAVYNAAEAFVSKYLASAHDGLTVSADDALGYSRSYPISSVTLNGTEMRRINIGCAAGGSYIKEAAGVLASAISEKYGYTAALSDSGEGELLLTTVGASPEYASTLGDSAARLTAISGKAVLVARDVGSLASATVKLAEWLGSTGTIEIKEGETAFSYVPGDTLRLMSFNILGNTDIAKRRSAVLWVIAKNSPDVFGIQEGKSDWLIYLGAKLDGVYASVGKSSAEGGSADTYDNIYYRTDRLELVTWDTVWLSDTPAVAGSKFGESKRVRIATYARLRDRLTGNETVVINTHLDNGSSAARVKQAGVLLDLASQFDCPVAVCGDFNSDMTSAVYDKMTGKLSDSRTDAASRDSYPTFNRLGEGMGTVLDYIFFSKGTEIISYRVSTALYGGKVYPSDHNAITAEFRLK